MVFDLLALDGWALRGCRQDDRSSLLERLLAEHASNRVRISERQDDAVAAFGRAACTHGLEGIIAKRRDARYMSGRGKAWLKVKCGHRQEFVIVGFTDPDGERVGFGALLLAYREGSRWLYAGGVGTGYSDRFLRDFRGKMEAIERTAPTVTLPKGVSSKGVHWVEPCYVGEVAFTEWTRDGILRHPSFLGLRDDKRPKDVVRELPVAPEGSRSNV
jgi:bifunctional non-homologous end joining protein LigD